MPAQRKRKYLIIFFLSFQVHLKMSPLQLHEVFHVNELDLVPHYELVKLSHLTSQHVRKKRSIASASSSSIKLGSSASGSSSSNSNNLVNSYNHHVKKDLSKSAPYAEKTTTTTTTDRSSIFANLNKKYEENSKSIKQVVNQSEHSDDDVRVSEIKEHKVTFDAFGEKLNLTLRPTEGLFRDGPQSLKIWHAHPDPNATDGINYEEIKAVSYFHCIHIHHLMHMQRSDIINIVNQIIHHHRRRRYEYSCAIQ